MPNVTNDQYWAAQDPRVRAIQDLVLPGSSLPDIAGRRTLAKQLFDLGFNPDGEIWIEGGDAGIRMYVRKTYGVPWVPNYEAPGYPTVADYAGKPWDRSIPTVTDAAAYPPFDQAPAPPPVQSGFVGVQNGEGVWAAINITLPGGRWAFAEGAPEAHDGQTLYFHLGWDFSGRREPMWLSQAKYDVFKATGAV